MILLLKLQYQDCHVFSALLDVERSGSILRRIMRAVKLNKFYEPFARFDKNQVAAIWNNYRGDRFVMALFCESKTSAPRNHKPPPSVCEGG
jgi:hypothetical protein